MFSLKHLLLPLFAMAATASAATPSFAEFDRRAREGETLSVVFFGGSLTWSANATEPNVTGFRGQMAKYFREKYPKARFTFTDAAIGGTGSALGMFRLERDVLKHHPDLVFLDFICNDGGENRDILGTCCYEYLLREMISRGIPVEQMFFTFKFWAEHGAPYDAPDCHPRLIDYRRLAEEYGTAVGDVYVDGLIPAIDSGEIDPDRAKAIGKVWPIDGGHPDDIGYFYFAKAGIAGYERAVAEGRLCRVPEKPVFGTARDVRRMNPALDGTLPEGWTRSLTYRTSSWYDGLSSRWMEDVAAFSGGEASPLTLRARGNFIGVFGEGDDDALPFRITADGREVFSGTAATGFGRLFIWRFAALSEQLEDDGAEHAFAIHPQPNGNGKSMLRIGSVCTATLVPNTPAITEGGGAEALEELDHARGKNL